MSSIEILSISKLVNSLKGVTWHTYSLFLPNDLRIHGFDWNCMGQFHFDGDAAPAFQWDVEYVGYELKRRTSCNLPENKNNINFLDINAEYLMEFSYKPRTNKEQHEKASCQLEAYSAGLAMTITSEALRANRIKPRPKQTNSTHTE